MDRAKIEEGVRLILVRHRRGSRAPGARRDAAPRGRDVRGHLLRPRRPTRPTSSCRCRATTTTRWCSSATSTSTRSASITCCRSPARRTWPTSRARRASIAGLSKLARLVRTVAARPQLQERITSEVADAIVRAAQPPGRAGADRGRAPVHVDARRAHAGRARPSPAPCAASCRVDAATRAEVLSLINAAALTSAGPTPARRPP